MMYYGYGMMCKAEDHKITNIDWYGLENQAKQIHKKISGK